jgi:hypothetical protein
MITKEQLNRDVRVSNTGELVRRPTSLGPYTQVDTSEGYRDMMRPAIERWGAELRLGINYNVDPESPPGYKEQQARHMVNSLHSMLYGGIRSCLCRVIDDVRMLSTDPDNPALIKLESLLEDLS